MAPASLPARGIVRIDGKEGQIVHLAFALQGRIETVTQSVLSRGSEASSLGHGLFSALLPDTSLRPGANIPDVYVIGSDASGPLGVLYGLQEEFQTPLQPGIAMTVGKGP